MYRSLADAVRDAEAGGVSLAQLALQTESEDQGRPIDEIRAVLARALTVMRGAVEGGLTGELKSARSPFSHSDTATSSETRSCTSSSSNVPRG